jgi:hypothetical protein
MSSKPTLASVGFEDIEINPTHRVHEHAANIRSRALASR